MTCLRPGRWPARSHLPRRARTCWPVTMSWNITANFGFSVGFSGFPPRLMYHDSHGTFEHTSGVPSVSADRVHRLRRRRREQQVHLVGQDRLLRQVPRPGHARLGVIGLDRHVIGLAADPEPLAVRGRLPDLGDHPVIRRAEPGQIPGQRMNPPDRDPLRAALPGTLDPRTARSSKPAGADGSGPGALACWLLGRPSHAAKVDSANSNVSNFVALLDGTVTFVLELPARSLRDCMPPWQGRRDTLGRLGAGLLTILACAA